MTGRSINEPFKACCDEAFSIVKGIHKLNYPIISDRIGEELDVPGTTIEYWKRGNPPREWQQLEEMVVVLIQLAGLRLDDDWVRNFLRAGNHPFVERGLTRVNERVGRPQAQPPTPLALGAQSPADGPHPISEAERSNEEHVTYVVIPRHLFILSLVLHLFLLLTHPIFSPLFRRKPEGQTQTARTD